MRTDSSGEGISPVGATADNGARLTRWKASFLFLLATVLVTGFAAVLWIVVDEVQTSRHQAQRLAAFDRKLQFALHPGPSDAIRFPGSGPYDQRLGYHALPQYLDRLTAQDWQITAQARMSPKLLDVIDHGLFAPYAEKNQAGFELLDCRADPLFLARLPQRAYGRFEAIPPPS